MKTLIGFLFVIVWGTGCAGSIGNGHSEVMELGWMQRENFMTPTYAQFKMNYDTVKVDNNFVEMIQSVHQGVDMVVVFGTWCADSKREVPRFLKIADLASIPKERIRFYGVDRTKKSADGVTDLYHIERVPTFIFLINGEEVGRIVEFPRHSLEEDMLAILADAQHK